MILKKLISWLDISDSSDFSIYNLPFGIFSTKTKQPRVGIAIGNQILDVAVANELGIFKKLDFDATTLKSNFLNSFIALGKSITVQIRLIVQEEFCKENSILKLNDNAFELQNEVTMHLPILVGDYTDFYSSIEHATNIGKMFRDPENALLPNWKHIPVGYHGRSSTIIPSGMPIHRPKGQYLVPGATKPVFGASTRLDIELETAFIVGKANKIGKEIAINDAEEHIFGMVLLNDWSARDIQKWEYVPLGPFLAKNFASTISLWVVTMEALAPFKVTGPKQDVEVLPYLKFKGAKNYNINLEVYLTTENGSENLISTSNFKYMYWNMAQQLAHHTVNGCKVNVGDMMGSGTISGKTKSSYGSLLELTWGGKNPLQLKDGSTRKFVNDNDTITLKGSCEKESIKIGFGEATTKLLPAHI